MKPKWTPVEEIDNDAGYDSVVYYKELTPDLGIFISYTGRTGAWNWQVFFDFDRRNKFFGMYHPTFCYASSFLSARKRVIQWSNKVKNGELSIHKK